MIQFGVLAKNISLSQHGILLLDSLNNISTEYGDRLSPVFFYETFSHTIEQPKFAMIQHREAWLFDGPIVTTSLAFAKTLIGCPKPNPKFLYMWNLEWIYLQPKPLTLFNDIYMNDNLQIIARSDSHARIIENCWKKPVAIIEDFNYHEIANLITGTGGTISDPVS